MPAFETQRLRCRPLSLAEYEAFALGVEPEWLDLTNPHRHLVDGPSPLRFRIPKVKLDESFAEIGLITQAGTLIKNCDYGIKIEDIGKVKFMKKSN